ncbi:bola protein [Scheffersomyces amazonensis]|uniref:bola protein n=1 Tax=Scheffersomyces amazonensis TaxID=1078765 RepID=UPI00315D5529
MFRSITSRVLVRPTVTVNAFKLQPQINGRLLSYTSILAQTQSASAIPQESEIPPMDAYEAKIYKILQDEFNPRNLQVKDVSGGCGSMFAILVESEKFKGIPMIKQHRLVNAVLKDEIAQWHGLQLRTKA